MTKSAFRAQCLLGVEVRNDVRQAPGDRVRRHARVAPLDLIVGDGVGQQIGLRLRQRLAACVAEGRGLAFIGKIKLVECEDRRGFVYRTR
ncbi:hypothetical protein QP162_19285 [Sphingomonas aurantiaca]|uniref:hypothetical protein n=1 Tax=Sphingomonas aurantiaca TaxID=185949 RepID=UPI002FE0F8DA